MRTLPPLRRKRQGEGRRWYLSEDADDGPCGLWRGLRNRVQSALEYHVRTIRHAERNFGTVRTVLPYFAHDNQRGRAFAVDIRHQSA